MLKLHGTVIDLSAVALTVLVGTLMLECLRPAPPVEPVEIAESIESELPVER